MKFLLTNDDGFDAIGIKVFAAKLKNFGEVYVVAPKRAQSGCSHQYVFNRPIEIEEVSENWFSCDAYPTDCVRIGLLELFEDIDWVFSGINQGANLGTDVFVSGTVAAAREATILKKKAAAFSHYRIKNSTLEWDVCEKLVDRVLAEILEKGVKENEFLNINFPDGIASQSVSDCQIMNCPLDLSPLPTSYQRTEKTVEANGVYQERLRRKNEDVDLCMKGNVTISKLKLN